MIGKWAKRSREVIQIAFEQWADTNGSFPSPSMPEADKKRFLKMLSNFYPFGVRKHFPYKVWCKEVREVKDWLAGPEQMPLGGLFEGVAV